MNSHTLFSLIPRIRATKPRTNVAALSLIVLVGIAAIGAIIILNGNQQATDQSAIVAQPSLKQILEKTAKADSTAPLYYAMKTNNLAETKIYQHNFDPSQQDTLVLEHKGDLHFYDTNTKDQTWVAGDAGILYIVDPINKKIEMLTKAPEGFIFYDAAFSHDTKKIAYLIKDSSQPSDGKQVAIEKTEMYVLDRASQKNEKVLDQTVGGLYTNKDPKNSVDIVIDGWSSGDTKLIASIKEEGKGNIGYIGGQRFFVDVRNKHSVTKIEGETPEEQSAFLYGGVVSPDGNYIATHYCSKPAKDGSCPEGERILLLDIEKGSVKTLHRYNANEEGFAKDPQGTANKVSSLSWNQDSSIVFFATPNGIFQVGIDAGTPGTVHLFSVGSNDPKIPTELALMGHYVSISPFITFPVDARALLNVDSNKFIIVPTPIITDSTFLQYLTY